MQAWEPILWMEKLRHRKAKSLPGGHTVGALQGGPVPPAGDLSAHPSAPRRRLRLFRVSLPFCWEERAAGHLVTRVPGAGGGGGVREGAGAGGLTPRADPCAGSPGPHRVGCCKEAWRPAGERSL